MTANVTVNASVSMTQPNTSRRVSQSVILLVNKRGGIRHTALAQQTKNGQTPTTAPPSSNGDHQATTAPRREYHHRRSTARRSSSRHCRPHQGQGDNHAGATPPEPSAAGQLQHERRRQPLAGTQRRLETKSGCERAHARKPTSPITQGYSATRTATADPRPRVRR